MVELPKLPEVEITDPEKGSFCLKLETFKVKTKNYFKNDRDKMNIVVYRYRNAFYFVSPRLENRGGMDKILDALGKTSKSTEFN